MFKKMIALVLCCIMVLPLCSPVFAVPAENDQDQYDSRSMEEILNDYHTKSRQIESQSDAGTNSRSVQTADTVRQDAVSELKLAGYEAYDVNPDTYAGVEAELNTDLSDIGLDPESSYIIVISGEDTRDNGQNSAGGSSRVITLPPHEWEGDNINQFSYTYNNETYTMRFLTITAAEFSSFKKMDDYDLLYSSSASVIANCLNTAVSAYVDLMTGPLMLGTVASICGLDISDFLPDETAKLVYTGCANWTRVYTQVLDPDDDSWMYASSVEYVNIVGFIDSTYYSAETNWYVSERSQEVKETVYSEYYSDTEWRKRKAVIGYLVNQTIFDHTGDVTFYYGGDDIITLRESF